MGAVVVPLVMAAEVGNVVAAPLLACVTVGP